MAINFEEEKSKYRINSVEGLTNRYDVSELQKKKHNYKNSFLPRWENKKKAYANAEKYIDEIQSSFKTVFDNLNSASSLMSESYKIPSKPTSSQTKLDDTIEKLASVKEYLDEKLFPAITNYKTGCDSVINVITDGIEKIEDAIEICNSRQSTTEE